jgi:hypothetical protein
MPRTRFADAGCDRGHSTTAGACTTRPTTLEKGAMASIAKRNDWHDPEADKADKEDQQALLSAFVVIIAICGAAFLLW